MSFLQVTSLRNLTLYSGLSQGVDLSVKVFMGRQFCWYTLSSLCSCYYLFRMVYIQADIFIDCSTFSWKVKCNWRGIAPLSLNSSDTGDGIFWLWGSIPCLQMPWLLKSPEHQQAWYWLHRSDNMYYGSRVSVIYLGLTKSKIWFKM